MTARITGLRSMQRSLKSFGAVFEAYDGIKGKSTTKVKLKVNQGRIQKILSISEKFPDAAIKAFRQSMKIIANDLHATLDDAMEANVWSWHDDMRDIIDTGNLRDSGRVTVDGDDIVIKYDEEYAAIVHYGGYIKSGYDPDVSIFYPGRRWVTSVLTGDGPVEQFDFQGELERNFFHFLGSTVLKELL